METQDAPRNRLARETSPYLQQHATNPVDWYSWGPEALARARAEDKPILLSIGYSACHWCHVMAHESFEDPAVAAVMNRLFVNVKVDREERPDIDQIYQTAHQMLAQRAGGWPLTMFLSPQGVPFFGGTYFPRTARYGMPAFPELCERIAAIWHEKRTEIEAQNADKGQPPPSPSTWIAFMYSVSTSGRSSRSTFTLTNSSFIRVATSRSSKHSWAITWHQWHAE